MYEKAIKKLGGYLAQNRQFSILCGMKVTKRRRSHPRFDNQGEPTDRSCAEAIPGHCCRPNTNETDSTITRDFFQAERTTWNRGSPTSYSSPNGMRPKRVCSTKSPKMSLRSMPPSPPMCRAMWLSFLAPPIPVPDTPSIARGRDSSTRSAARCATRRPSQQEGHQAER